MSPRQQQRLQLPPFRPPDARIIRRPRRRERPATAQPVRQIRDRERIAFRRVVRIDRIVVLEHNERRTRRPRRQHHRGARIRRHAIERRAIHPPHALRHPLRQRLPVRPPRLRRIEPRRQLHLVPPGLAATPARLLQIVRRRPQRIRNAADQVAPPVTVDIHRDPLVRRRHELRMPERARPRPGDAGIAQVAARQQLQRGDELTLEERLPPPEARQRRQRREQRPLAEAAPVVALHAPYRHHRRGVHAVVRLHALQRRGVFAQHGQAVVHALPVDQRGEVVPDRRGELRLLVEQRQHRHVRREPRRQAVEGGTVDALAGRRATQPRHALAVGRQFAVAGRGWRRRRGDGRRRDRRRGRSRRGSWRRGRRCYRLPRGRGWLLRTCHAQRQGQQQEGHGRQAHRRLRIGSPGL